MVGKRETKPIQILLTPEEHRTLSEAARASGLGIGPWLRSLGLYFAGQPRPFYPPAPRRVASRRKAP